MLGSQFSIRTDQKSIKYMMEQRVLATQQQKWLSKLLGFTFEIQYRLGRENCVTDALSRKVQYFANHFVPEAQDDQQTMGQLTVYCYDSILFLGRIV